MAQCDSHEEIKKELQSIRYDIGSIKLETALTRQDVEHIKENVHELRKDLDTNFVTLAEYSPIQKLVYGAVAIIGMTILIAILTLVIPTAKGEMDDGQTRSTYENISK